MALPPAAIVDIDGTVALHRLPDGRLLRDHHAYRAVAWDLPNPPIIGAVLALRAAGVEPVFCSGRPEFDDHGYPVRRATVEWLADHLGEWARERPLLMRAQHDRRPDDEVKLDLYEKGVHGRYDVRLVLDDRPRVIRMWLALGLPVVDVAPGSGEF